MHTSSPSPPSPPPPPAPAAPAIPEAEEEEEEEAEAEAGGGAVPGLILSTLDTGREREVAASLNAKVDKTERVTALLIRSNRVCCSSVTMASANFMTSSDLANSIL